MWTGKRLPEWTTISIGVSKHTATYRIIAIDDVEMSHGIIEERDRWLNHVCVGRTVFLMCAISTATRVLKS